MISTQKDSSIRKWIRTLAIIILISGNIALGTLLFFSEQKNAQLEEQQAQNLTTISQHKENVSAQEEKIEQLEQENKNMRNEIARLNFVPLVESEEKQLALQQKVEDIRQLPFMEDTSFVLKTPEEIKAFIVDNAEEEMPDEEIQISNRIYARLGAWQEGFDIKAHMYELMEEQVVGFYNPETGEIVLSKNGQEDSESTQKFTLFHELIHAVTDQHFPEVYGLYENLSEIRDDDMSLAIQALIEGDATLSMYQYVARNPSIGFMMGISEIASETESPIFDTSPLYVQESLLFPYLDGMTFVQYWAQDDLQSINSLYTSPPLSTEQILHPHKYQEDFPERVTLTSPILRRGYTQKTSFSFGELEVLLTLKTLLDEDTASEAAAGWDGGQLQYFENRNNHALLTLALTWDSEEERNEFVTIFQNDFLTARFPDIEVIESDPPIFQISESRFLGIAPLDTYHVLIVDGDTVADVRATLAQSSISTEEILEIPEEYWNMSK